ncbi:hypothetical protein E2P81_ATG03498 [Venturia nashicola]|nr:hypothetical protein E2P81_ATG03498 [Venturia nashicola]
MSAKCSDRSRDASTGGLPAEEGFKNLSVSAESDYGILDTCYRFEGNEYFPFDMEEQNECDNAWDRLSEKFFALKKELAKEARKEAKETAFIAQKKGGLGAVAKK